MNPEIFITGATGFVGFNITQKILNENPEAIVYLLVRPRSSKAMNEKLGVLVTTYGYARIHLIKGDIRSKRLGINSRKYHKIARRITHIIHAAADTRFDNSLKEAKSSNYTGTVNLMMFAEYVSTFGNLQNVAHISTAFVAGKRSGIIYEKDMICNHGFSNSYEHSKYEAEQMIRREFSHLPFIIFRPSIIVGHSVTGVTSNFNVLYYPLKLLCKGALRAIPARKDILLDVVPIDYVCDAIYQIMFNSHNPGKKVFHLTAGKDRAISIGEWTEHAIRYFQTQNTGYKLKRVWFLWPGLTTILVHSVLRFACRLRKIVRIYGPYLSASRVFDDRTTKAALKNTTINTPTPTQYIGTILRFCIKTDWGKSLNIQSV